MRAEFGLVICVSRWSAQRLATWFELLVVWGLSVALTDVPTLHSDAPLGETLGPLMLALTGRRVEIGDG
jgi:hypothetical protein